MIMMMIVIELEPFIKNSSHDSKHTAPKSGNFPNGSNEANAQACCEKQELSPLKRTDRLQILVTLTNTTLNLLSEHRNSSKTPIALVGNLCHPNRKLVSFCPSCIPSSSKKCTLLIYPKLSHNPKLTYEGKLRLSGSEAGTPCPSGTCRRLCLLSSPD